jgi:hypothetical protein
MIETIVAQAATDATPSAASPVTYVVLAVVAGWLIQTQTGVDLLGPLRGLRASDDVGGSFPGASDDPGLGLTRPRTVAIVALGGFAVAVMVGALGLSASVQVPLAAVAVLLATYLTLRGLGSYSFRLFAVVAGGVVLLGLSALGEPLIGAIVNSRVFPILAIGGLYLAYKAVQNLGSDQRERVIIRRGGDGGR